MALPDEIWIAALGWLSTADLGRAHVAGWRLVPTCEPLWAAALARDWGERASDNTARSEWLRWRRRGIPAAYVRRAKRVWARLDAWLLAHAPDILETLRPGAALPADSPLPPALRAVLAVHDGQERTTRLRVLGGVLGGSHFADIGSYMLLLEAEAVLGSADPPGMGGSMCVAVCLAGRAPRRLWMRPDGLLEFERRDGPRVPAVTSGPPAESLFVWLEAYVAGLEAGRFRAEPSPLRGGGGAEPSSLISTVPRLARAEAVTRNVRVRVAFVYVPQLSSADEARFMYHVSMRRLPGAGVGSCQLTRRVLDIVSLGAPHEDPVHVEGDAVVGEFPLLRPTDERDFEYCSNTPITLARGEAEWRGRAVGTFSGAYVFVEGSIEAPGEEFEARIPEVEFVVGEVLV